MIKLGEYVKERRFAKSISMRTMATLSGLSVSEISRVERGTVKNPSVPTIYAFADALGIPREDIMLIAGYTRDDGDSRFILERCFPNLQTNAQRCAAQKIIDTMMKYSKRLSEEDYDGLVEQVQMFLAFRNSQF